MNSDFCCAYRLIPINPPKKNLVWRRTCPPPRQYFEHNVFHHPTCSKGGENSHETTEFFCAYAPMGLCLSAPRKRHKGCGTLGPRRERKVRSVWSCDELHQSDRQGVPGTRFARTTLCTGTGSTDFTTTRLPKRSQPSARMLYQKRQMQSRSFFSFQWTCKFPKFLWIWINISKYV